METTEKVKMMNITNSNVIQEDKKEKALDFILLHCFRSGFGALGKSELDLILFAALMKYANQKDKSDYALSKYLQITKQRVRNLKEKASVKYNVIDQKDAIQYFVNQSRHAVIHKDNMDIPIFKIPVRNEIESILERQNGLLHTQLNEDIFRISINDFIKLTIFIESMSSSEKNHEDIQNEVLEEIQKKLSQKEMLNDQLNYSQGKKVNGAVIDIFQEMVIKAGFACVIDVLASLVPGGTLVSPWIKALLNNLKDKI